MSSAADRPDENASEASVPGLQHRMLITPDLLLRHLYDANADFAIITTDTDSRITSWNAAAQAIFGYAETDVLGGSTSLLFTEHDLMAGQPFQEMKNAESQGKSGDFRWHVRKGGTLFWADGVMWPLREPSGQVIGFLKILRDITDRKAAHDEVERLATVDSLTGLYNRATFDLRRNELASTALRNGQELLLFMIDLDRFKEVNDTLGHQAGDRLLQEAAARIRANTRESDIVARIGGDEFGLLHLNSGSPLHGAALANKILDAFRVPFHIGGRDTYASASIGIAVFPSDAATPDGLIKCADLALYEAKAQGRNGFHYYTEALDLIAHQRSVAQTELKRLQRVRGFHIAYQPIVDAPSGNTIAMEALLRVPGPLLSNFTVDYIIELAKEIGLVPAIGSWIFEQACAGLAAWRATGHAPPRIAVNTCAQELLAPKYLHKLVEVLERYRIAALDVDLELTERDAIELDLTSSTILHRLRDMGFGLILDDFGTGYSSLSYLRALPVSGLKLDKSFLRDVPDDADASAVTQAVISLAKNLRLSVTAEGVEQQKQMNFLRSAGCDAFQGFLVAVPMSAEDASTWLGAHQSAGDALPAPGPAG